MHLTGALARVYENLETEKKDLRKKKIVYVNSKIKKIAWARWMKEYIIALRERHNMKTKVPMSSANVGKVVIHCDNQKKGKWTLGVITGVFSGPDSIVRPVPVKQQVVFGMRGAALYPLELSCGITRNTDSQTNKVVETADLKLNVEATEFRPMRNVTATNDLGIDIIQDENKPTPVE